MIPRPTTRVIFSFVVLNEYCCTSFCHYVEYFELFHTVVTCRWGTPDSRGSGGYFPNREGRFGCFRSKSRYWWKRRCYRFFSVKGWAGGELRKHSHGFIDTKWCLVVIYMRSCVRACACMCVRVCRTVYVRAYLRSRGSEHFPVEGQRSTVFLAIEYNVGLPLNTFPTSQF